MRPLFSSLFDSAKRGFDDTALDIVVFGNHHKPSLPDLVWLPWPVKLMPDAGAYGLNQQPHGFAGDSCVSFNA